MLNLNGFSKILILLLDTWECSFDELSCGSGSRCIPLTWKCDGKKHCSSGLDEINCHSECTNDQFWCADSRTCIPSVWKCNGIKDCLSGEDEKLCSEYFTNCSILFICT